MKKLFDFQLDKHSLKYKLNISILTCVFFGFLCFIFLISKQAEPIIRAQINAIAEKTVETYVNNFSHLVSDTEHIIINAKNTLNQTTEEHVDTLKVTLHSAFKTADFSNLNFVNAWLYVFQPEDVSSGNLYISTYDTETENIDFKIEEISNFYERFSWFKEVPKKEKIYWSEPYFDKESKKTVVTCLIPFKFFEQNDFNGLIALTVDLSGIQKRISNFSFYETGKLLLLSKSGLYVTFPDPKVALRMTIFELAEKLELPALRTVGRQLSRGRKGKISVPDLPVFNDTAIFYYAPIKNIGWSFCLVYEQSYLLRPIHKFQTIIVISLAICILLLLFIINWISGNATNQLIKLGNIAEKYGKGNFSENFNEKPSSADIEQLAKALSHMRGNLLDYINKERNIASEKQKAQSELDIARHIQNSALATQYPQSEAFEIATMMIPARQVGGDFYDFFFIDDNKFAIVIADVSGKGIPAALYMMKAITLIKNICLSQKSLDFVFKHVNEQLCNSNDSFMFVTAFMAVIDLSTGKTKFVNAGHTPPLLKNNAGAFFLKPKRNIILGVKPEATFVEEEIKLEPNTRFFLYTDGVTEAENKQAQFYGEKRLLKTYQKTHNHPQTNLHLILNDIKKFVKNNPQSDDITMLEFAYKGYKPGTFTISANIQKLKEFLTYLKEDMIKHKLSEKSQFNMVMAAEEIFSNIALYAYDSKENALVTISTDLIDDTYYITFKDNGKKYNPLKSSTPNINADIKDKVIGGLGIFLAKELSDTQNYSYRNKQNILKIGINVHK